MKKSLLLLLFSSSTLFSYGQTIPNGDFENWETKTLSLPGIPLPFEYEDLTKWSTFNIASALGYEVSAKKVTDAASGNYAVKITNIESMDTEGKDTLPGVIVAEILPVGSPKYLNGYYKSNTPVGEQGQVLVFGHKKGDGPQTNAILGYTTFAAQATTYTPFSISLLQLPTVELDTIRIIVSSYSYIGIQQPQWTIGAYVQVDELAFSDFTTSLVEDVLKDGLQLSPNPSNGTFTISNEFGSLQHIEVTNATGVSVYSEKTSGASQFIDLSNQPKGLYILYAKANEKVYSKKLMIQ